jgi:hypothetical protein
MTVTTLNAEGGWPPLPAATRPESQQQTGLWGTMLNEVLTALISAVDQARSGVSEATAAADRVMASALIQVVKVGGEYPQRPDGATYVRWVGNSDPSAQPGLVVRDDADSWLNTGATA